MEKYGKYKMNENTIQILIYIGMITFGYIMGRTHPKGGIKNGI